MSAAEIIDLVRRSGLRDPTDLCDLAVGLVARLIVAGLVRAGDVDEAGHVPWRCPDSEAITRIALDWTSRVDPFVMPGEIVWLDATPVGQAIGESVLEREAK